ncbi:hypothetical protein F2Q69_00030482 [Brassica cretica]|uniref:Uncharacterized protein n=1 Tax=Brassica cretica TaxID=69181 RepID=A0A8S9RSM9_BRACR|nr:hypothetical protein F2Q69_00030482 [Brassica cretica]
MRPIRAVFHLLTILVKVVDPDDMRICLTRFSNDFMCSSSTRRKAAAVLSLYPNFESTHAEEKVGIVDMKN